MRLLAYKGVTNKLLSVAHRRPPDRVVGDSQSPYLRRWFLVPQNKFLNIYLHHFLQSDDDGALHDHPWCNVSVLLRGMYAEHTDRSSGMPEVLREGSIKVRASGKNAHRVELVDGDCWTLFITGPKYRKWGFHCRSGWIPWNQYLAPSKSGKGDEGCLD